MNLRIHLKYKTPILVPERMKY